MLDEKTKESLKIIAIDLRNIRTMIKTQHETIVELRREIDGLKQREVMSKHY